LSAGCSLLRAEVFSWSLDDDVLGINKQEFKKIRKVFSCKILQLFVIKTLDPDPELDPPKMLDPDTHENQIHTQH
jgi:hypothetical protein